MRAAAAARAAAANCNSSKCDVVEHVHVGRYCFPLYSHPAFRTRLEEDAYVREKIEAQLRSPALQSALGELVEELLAQGTNGVSGEELQRLLQSKLATLDVYYSNNTKGDENAQTAGEEGVTEGQTTNAAHIQPHPPLALDAVACNTKRRVRTSGIESYSPLTIISRDSVTCTLHTTTNIHIPTATTATAATAEGVMGPTEHQTHSTPLLEDTASPSQAASTLPSPAAATLSQHINDTTATTSMRLHERRFAPAPQLPPGLPLITHTSQQQQLHDAHSRETPTRHSRVMPDLQPAVIAAHDFLPQNKSPKDIDDEKKLTSGSGEASWRAASQQLSSRGTTQRSGKYNDIHDQSYKNEAVVPLRQWRGAVHGAVYSLLQQRLTHYSTGVVSSPQESAAGHVLLSEMNRASNTLLAQGAVDTEMLQTRLSDKVFAVLDVAMDGNSSCLHHRRRAPVARRPNAGLLPLQVSAHQRAARQRLLHEQQMLYDCEGDGCNNYGGSSSKHRSGMQDSVQSKARRIAASLREKKIRAMCEQAPHVQQRQSIVELASRTHTTPAIREESNTNTTSTTDKSFLTSHSVGVQPDTRRQSEVMEQEPLMHSDTHTGRTSLSHKSSSLLLLQPLPRPPHLAGHHAPSYLTSSFHDVCAPLLTFRRLHSPEMRTLPGGVNVEAGNVPTLASCDLAGRVQPMPLQATQHVEGGQDNEGDVKQQQQQMTMTTSNQARMASRWTTQDAAWNKALQRIRNGPS